MKNQTVTAIASVLLALVTGCTASTEAGDANDVASDDLRGRPVPSVGEQATLTLLNTNGMELESKSAVVRIVGNEITLRSGTVNARNERTFEAAKLSDSTDGCKVRTIRGVTDQRPVDGARTEIVIVDGSKADSGRFCDSVQRNLVVSVTRDVTSRSDSSNSRSFANFIGTKLLTIPAGPAPSALVKLYSCSSPSSNAKVEFFGTSPNSDATRATLSLKGKLVGDYKSSINVDSGIVAADLPREILSFRDFTLFDGGYSVALTSGNFAGIQFAHVEQISIAGSERIANLPCRSN
jgi:hypothetical protein